MSATIAIRLRAGALDEAWARACVQGADAGCNLLFLGTVRATSADGRRVLRLEYEAYADMAEAELHSLAGEACARHGLLRVAIEHALGPVAAGETSVVVAVAAEHRSTVFLAAAEIMDALKKRAPLWKREIYADGSAWLGQGS